MFVLAVLLLLSPFMDCYEFSQHTVHLYKLERNAFLVSHEFAFATTISSDVLYAQNFPMAFLYFAAHTNFTEYSAHLVQGRWEDYMKPYFLQGLDEPFVRFSLKSALGFDTFDGGLTFSASLPLDLNKVVNFLNGFLCSGTDRLMKNLVTLKNPSGPISYGADPMNYLCYDNLVHLLDILNPSQKDQVARMLDKQVFGQSPYTQLDISQKKTDSHIDLNIRISFIVSYDQSVKENIQIFPMLEASQVFVKLYHSNPAMYLSYNTTEDIPLSELLAKLQETAPISPYFEPISIRRHITSVDHELHAKYVVVIQNNNGKEKGKVWVQEFLPHFLRPYFHTLVLAKTNSAHIVPLNVTYNEKSDCYFDLGVFELLPNESIKITMEIEKLLLPFEEYPHDSSRGFDIPQMMFLYKMDNEAEWHKTYVPSIVLMLPQPDFSMPFNVHALYCVLVGIMFKIYLNIIDTLSQPSLLMHIAYHMQANTTNKSESQQQAILSNYMEVKKEVKGTLVLDTNVFIKMVDVRQKYDADFCTVPDVLAEIRDEKVLTICQQRQTRQYISSLPFTLATKTPTKESLAFGIFCAKNANSYWIRKTYGRLQEFVLSRHKGDCSRTFFIGRKR
eukprot:TRINITY_DN87979_c1_g1_i1.p1 TRINITY_DN87979_c1_g1~~TRINITY_DN87979_c1_g1_i1.p1  ORF type:complete len:616 (-),score=19.50 TRINITY_DN87979_c1_g1_i1:1028-2875(-)